MPSTSASEFSAGNDTSLLRDYEKKSTVAYAAKGKGENPVPVKLIRRGSSERCDLLCTLVQSAILTTNHFHDSFPLAKNALHLSTCTSLKLVVPFRLFDDVSQSSEARNIDACALTRKNRPRSYH